MDSHKATAQPWLHSLDFLNTHDDAYPLSISGGVTCPAWFRYRMGATASDGLVNDPWSLDSMS